MQSVALLLHALILYEHWLCHCCCFPANWPSGFRLRSPRRSGTRQRQNNIRNAIEKIPNTTWIHNNTELVSQPCAVKKNKKHTANSEPMPWHGFGTQMSPSCCSMCSLPAGNTASREQMEALALRQPGGYSGRRPNATAATSFWSIREQKKNFHCVHVCLGTHVTVCVYLVAICGFDALFVCVCDSEDSQKVKLRRCCGGLHRCRGGKRFAGGRSRGPDQSG